MIPRVALAFLLAVTLLPDEGQWLPTQIREMDWQALEKRGMKLTKDEFWHPEKGGVLSATVQINGCTASFCSGDGLLVTNHHCGFSAVSELSTPEHNWLRDGYQAQTLEQELPAPGVVASVLKRIENITEQVHAEQAKATTDLERYDATQRALARIVRDAEKKEANTECTVASFLEGKEYHLYYRTRLTDVRLVYVPPRAIGEFGGEVDNWEWPRHTGDFTFFRAYVGKDGQPADYAKDNVPFHPEHFLLVSTEGVVAGDLAIIMGYPGRTQRYKSSLAVATQQTYVYPKRTAVLAQAIAALEAAGKTSEAKGLEVADRIKSLANVEKNARGMIFGLANNGTVAKKQDEERQFAAWLAQDAGRKEKWGSVLAELLAMDEDEASTIERDTMMWFLRVLGDDVPLLSGLVEACGGVAAGRKAQSFAKVLGTEPFDRDWDLVQRPLCAILLAEFASMSQAQSLAGMQLPAAENAEAAATAALLQTKMTDPAARKALFDQGDEAVAASSDPLLVVARAIAAERPLWQRRMRERGGKSLDVGRRWIEAQEAFRGTSFYPDANSTLRVSIAEVSGYEPRDGLVAMPHTTVGGIVQKETGKEPFASPKMLLEAAKTRLQSRWVDPRLGDVPACFLTNGDTTGGNSGSPVIDGKGRLIGLNFDRVFEAVAGDFGWSPKLSRNVVCDIRYVLWVADQVYPCPRLLKELGV